MPLVNLFPHLLPCRMRNSPHDAAWTVALPGVMRTDLEHFACLTHPTLPRPALGPPPPHSKQNSALMLHEWPHRRFIWPRHLPMVAHFFCQQTWMSACQALNQYLFFPLLLCDVYSAKDWHFWKKRKKRSLSLCSKGLLLNLCTVPLKQPVP